jgi:hypothetical protein
MDIAPGCPWIPFDQIDWLVSALAFGWMALDLAAEILLNVLVVGVVSHLVVNAVAMPWDTSSGCGGVGFDGRYGLLGFPRERVNGGT